MYAIPSEDNISILIPVCGLNFRENGSSDFGLLSALIYRFNDKEADNQIS
jgi:hypothetical protein